MCQVEDYDADGEWCVDPHVRLMIVRHLCGDCGRAIQSGEDYTYGEWKFEDGYVAKMRCCAHCVIAGEWLDRVCGGFRWTGVVDDLVEHWDEADLRTMALGRLILLAGRKWVWRGALVPLGEVKRLVDEALAPFAIEFGTFSPVEIPVPDPPVTRGAIRVTVWGHS